MRFFGTRLVLCLPLIGLLLLPAPAAAEAMAVSQVIVITATVAPARSIIVNDQGQATQIISNTPQNVTPKVYVNKMFGPEQPLTPSLQQQYRSVIAGHKNLNGVVIDVPLPVTQSVQGDLRTLLTKTMSVMRLQVL